MTEFIALHLTAVNGMGILIVILVTAIVAVSIIYEIIRFNEKKQINKPKERISYDAKDTSLRRYR
jgi:Na+-transporting methylmalonyl-CoA/oxaloacetate decarboxylase gamma subunit